MCTYEDLLRDTVIRCKSEKEFDSLVSYLQNCGEHKQLASWDPYDDYLFVDILEIENPERQIVGSTDKDVYEDMSIDVTIIDFKELDMCVKQEPVDVDKFIGFLLG